MSIKHLRISVPHKLSSQVFESFIAKFKPYKWLGAYENKNYFTHYNGHLDHNECKLIKCLDENEIEENEKNPHIQALIYYNENSIPTKQQISEFFKSQPILKGKDENGKNIAGYYHKEINKSEECNILYILKDGHIISKDGFKEDEWNELIKKTNEINNDKKLSSKEKLYNRYIEKFGLIYPSSKFNIFKFIDEIYIFEFKKSPLAIGHKTSYAIHILMHIHKNINEKNEDYYDILLRNIYNIKDHNELLFDLNNEKNKMEILRSLNVEYNCDFIDEDEDETPTKKELKQKKFNKKYNIKN